MKKIGPRYRVRFKREREGRTNYRHRLKLLRSKKPRLVARISSKHVTAQIIQAAPTGDATLASAHSKQLEKLGWKGHTSNTSAAYLVGLLCGYRAVKAGVKECVFDMGMYGPIPQAKVFAVLKGALDGNLQIPHGEGVLPGEDRVNGTHISKYASKLKEDDPEAYKLRFSGYIARGLTPERMLEHFNTVKQAITKQFSR